MAETVTTAPAEVRNLEAAGVSLVTVAGGFGLYALVFSLGAGEPMSLRAVVVATLLGASAALIWRIGPRRVEPLVVGLLLCSAGLSLMDLPLLAAVPVLMAGAITIRRVSRSQSARSD